MSQATEQKYETVIGLEVHLQLKTKTKIFCGCANEFGHEPNSHVCPVCLGLPGTLPVVNKKALEYAIRVGLALNCQINPYVKFDRKNYYYPDLPKGYQISQFDLPICSDGFIQIPVEGTWKKITVKRAHLEEDAGKLIHDQHANGSLVDYNRTGTPLLEIVTEPDLRSPDEAYDYLNILKLTLQYLDVSDCDMEKGSLRCDANVSIREFGDTKLGTKTELKNMNSFRAVKVALEHEIERHRRMRDSGEKITQETRLWDEAKQMTIAMRSKEEAHDYRYFPEPDLVPFVVGQDIIDQIKKELPELPPAKLERLMKQYVMSEYDARIIIQDQAMADFFEECAKLYKDSKKICNWLNGAVLNEMNSRKATIQTVKLPARELTALIQKVDEDILSNLVAKDVLKFIIDTGKSVDTIIEEKGLAQVSDDGMLMTIVDQVISENPKIVAQIKEGKDAAAGFLVGQAMKKSQGKANPKKIGELIKRRLLNV
jgi:aspartyl-tRNA(Asn)/glutamyl-tRNA(Gln) amidotransferase subunit B